METVMSLFVLIIVSNIFKEIDLEMEEEILI